ncbi:Uncharacterised protein [Bordetella trematum]|nr:Uncharacterised protein [Bordetella trematum]
MRAGLQQGAHHQTAEHQTRHHHQQQRQHHCRPDRHQGAVEALAGVVDGFLLALIDVAAEVADCRDERGAARHAVLGVDHVEGRVILALERFDHGIHAIVDIGAVTPHQIHRQLTAGGVLQHVLLEVAETVAHAAQQIGCLLDDLRRLLAGVLPIAPAGLLQMARGHHQIDAGAQHVAIDDLHLLGARCQIVELLHGAVVLLQEISRQGPDCGNKDREKTQQTQKKAAHARVAQGPGTAALLLGRTRTLLALGRTGLVFVTGFHVFPRFFGWCDK